MNTITIKEIEKKEFDDAKNLLKNGLNELAFNLFDLSTVKSKNIQAVFVASALLLSWMIVFTWLKFLVLLVLIELAAYRFISYQWTAIMNTEMCEMKDWETFSKFYGQDSLNRFWVAVENSSGHVIGTTSVVVFGDYKRIKGCGVQVTLDNIDRNESTESKRYASVELKRLTIMRPYRGTGLSQKMMDQADSYVKAQHEKNIFISKVVLFVNIFQEKARRLYERNKFALVQKWDLPMYFGLSTRVLCFYEKKVEN